MKIANSGVNQNVVGENSGTSRPQCTDLLDSDDAKTEIYISNLLYFCSDCQKQPHDPIDLKTCSKYIVPKSARQQTRSATSFLAVMSQVVTNKLTVFCAVK